MARVALSHRDLRGMMSLVHDVPDDDLDEPLPWSVLHGLKDLVCCDSVWVGGIDSANADVFASQLLPTEVESDDPGSEVFFAHYWNFLPCSYPDQTGDLGSVTTASDFYSVRRLRSTGMYAEYISKAGFLREMMVCLPGPSGRIVRFVFWRGPGRDFSDRDRAVLAIMRPHLHRIWRERERRRQGAPRVTPRQLELLRLVADGFTNRQIGRRLGVAESTVRKHLQHVFERLDVSNRAAAIARAFPDGPPTG